MIFALLAAVIVAGLVTTLITSVVTGQRSVRFDQKFVGAVHVAEGGVEEVVFKLNNRQIDDGDSPVSGAGTLNEQPFEWTAEQLDDHVWRVVSDGSDGDVQRTVEALVADQPLFDLAAFSDNLVNFTGANNADSYHSEELEWCTGKGRVGSNDDLDFSGSAGGQATCDYDRPDQTVDGVDLYDWESNADPDRCVHSGGTNCYYGGEAQYDTHDEPVEFDDDVEWMDDVLSRCAAESKLAGTVKSSDAGFALSPATAATGVQLDPGNPESPYAHCAQELIFDQDAALSGGASPDDPVVYVIGNWLEVKAQTRVNCVGCSTGGTFNPKDDGLFPKAGALQFYLPAEVNPSASTDDVVGIRQHARVAATVLAPKGTCGGVGNAAVHIFGALICGDIRNAGGWSFHYDEALADLIRTGKFAISRWSEL